MEFFNYILNTLFTEPLYLGAGGVSVALIMFAIVKKKKNKLEVDTAEDDVYDSRIITKKPKKHNIDSITIDTQEFENEFISDENSAQIVINKSINNTTSNDSRIQNAIIFDKAGEKNHAIAYLEDYLNEMIRENAPLNESEYLNKIISLYKDNNTFSPKSLEEIIETVDRHNTYSSNIQSSTLLHNNETINDIFGIHEANDNDDTPTLSSLLKKEEETSWLDNEANEALNQISHSRQEDSALSVEDSFNIHKNNPDIETEKNEHINPFHLPESSISEQGDISLSLEESDSKKDKVTEPPKDSLSHEDKNEDTQKIENLDIVSLLGEVKDVSDPSTKNSLSEVENLSVEDIMLNIHKDLSISEWEQKEKEVTELEDSINLEEEITKNINSSFNIDSLEKNTENDQKPNFTNESFLNEFSSMIINLDNEVKSNQQNGISNKDNLDNQTIWINWILEENGSSTIKKSTLDLEGQWGTKGAIEQLSAFLDSESGKLYNPSINWGVISVQVVK